MKYYQGDSLINSAINKLPFEMHIPGYNWCGPGTKVEKRLARNDPGINGLDEACKEHDIFYSNESDLSRRHEADRVLKRKALARVKAKDASWKEKLAALGVAGAMKAKVTFGMGLQKNKQQRRTITNCKKKLQKIKQELSSSLKHVEEVFKFLHENTANSNNGTSSKSRRKTVKKRQTTIEKKIMGDDDHPVNKVNKTKTKKQNKIEKRNVDIVRKVQRKRKNIKNTTNGSKKKIQEILEDLPMDVVSDDDYSMNRIQRKRKIDCDDLEEQPLHKRSLVKKRKEPLIKMDEPIIYPTIGSSSSSSSSSRKRKLSAIADEIIIPEKVQVINTE